MVIKPEKQGSLFSIFKTLPLLKKTGGRYMCPDRAIGNKV